jgi:hypothetical protein
MELGPCDRDQLERMALKFVDDPGEAARFADSLAPGRWSPAQVQERLLQAADVDEALALFAEREGVVTAMRAA